MFNAAAGWSASSAPPRRFAFDGYLGKAMEHRRINLVVLLLINLLVVGLGTSLAADHSQSAAEAAARVDRLLATETQPKADPAATQPTASVAAPQASDETWLRRVYLDLIGQTPTPDELTLFVLNNSPDKRSNAVARLLADSRYGENWARYWRDVILSRRTDERALLAGQSVVKWLSTEFNQGASWKSIAHEFITADGVLAENGQTALIAAQWGEVPETAAEVSRVLMGVQIQCAQCHDHKTDRWKRTQFHELAAFFPRIAILAIKAEDGKRRGFELISRDGQVPNRKKNVNNKANPRLEHFMPDLEDPAAKGTLMQPVFFVTEEKLETGIPDHDRRDVLADWMTSEENPWFAKAVVNRLWAELVGEGFYEPIDDIGPDKECAAPKTLNYLSKQFIEHDYDLKWLLGSITATEIYGRESRPRRLTDQQPFAATCPQPLRADQIYDNLVAMLGLEGSQADPADGKKPKEKGRGGPQSPRGQFLAKFGFDPSAPRDEHTGSIDQALLLMNAPALARAVSARQKPGQPITSVLSTLLGENEDDETVLSELYLRCLAREATETEINTCREYIAEVGNRSEAFEDIVWALVNSTEFLYRD